MTSSIELRPLCEADVDSILSWVNDPSIVGNLAAFSGQPMTREAELEWIRRTISSSTDVVFSVFRGETYLGQVGIHQIFSRSKVGRLGVVIASRGEMGKGYGTAAIRAALDHGFGVLGLHKLWLMVFAHNTRSLGIYERIGFVREGVLREEYFHDSRWHDMVRMSMLAAEWEQQRERLDQ